MSKRPTNVSRREVSNAHSSANGYGYAIIGDTAAATLYAKRLLGNNVTTPISIISEGVDRMNIEDITDIDFAATNNKKILHYLNVEQIHMIPSGDNPNDNDDEITFQTEQIIHYHVGSGPLGDFIAAYHIPRLGPWFTHSTNGRLERFLSESTVKSPLTSQESLVMNRLSSLWGLTQTSSIIVKNPSILNVHYEFLKQVQDTYVREIFQDQYHMVNHASNADYISEATNLRFTATTGTTGITGNGLYNITGNNINLQAIRPIWKTNAYTYLRLANEGGINTGPLMLPTFYRAVISVPIGGTGITGITGFAGFTGLTGIIGCTAVTGPSGHVCFSCTGLSGLSGTNLGSVIGVSGMTCICVPTDGGVGAGLSGIFCFVGQSGLSGIDFTGVSGTEDLITSHITFSLYDLANPRNSGLAWLVQAYTTLEDLSVVALNGRYADTGRMLLIVEALSTKNKRSTSYNTGEHEIQVNYNDRLAENGYFSQFAQIVAGVYNAYTGGFIPVDLLLSDASICAPISGMCSDGDFVLDYSVRESPMVSVIELASNLYGVDIYPNPSK